MGPEASSLEPSEKVKLDLKQQLRRNLKKIGRQYASYVRCIYTALGAKGITADDLTAYLLKLPALKVDTDDEQHKLLTGIGTELKKAETIHEIINLLDENCASFIDYDIFEGIVDEYNVSEGLTDKNREKLNYPEHLKTYIEMHKLSEFIKINPKLSKHTSHSEELTLKFEIDLSKYRLADLDELKPIISDILEIKTSTLRLLCIEEGCVVVTFLIPSSVAHFIFPSGKVLTAQQMKRFRDLSALWLKCCGCYVDFTQTATDQRYYLYT